MSRGYNAKQMGDACEMLVAAELTLAGMPALKAPDNWPGYDVLAQPPGNVPPLRISVKARTYEPPAPARPIFNATDIFDWLAVVLLECPEKPRRIFLIPRHIADERASKNGPETKTSNRRYWPIARTAALFSEFEDNFTLCEDGVTA